tara:strand:- start:182 stop:763 length:582 start_codon:yes stop_codon:yes gene_type:complete
MPIRHRRDVKTINPPSAEEISVGEIVMNSRTGKLYIVSAQAIYDDSGKQIGVKKQNVIEFSGKVVCSEVDSVPDISFDDVSTFCCFGDTLAVDVSGLDRVTNYDFVMTELTANQSTISLSTPKYTNYLLEPEGSDTDPSLIQEYRSALIPININVARENSAVSVFKFGIEVDNVLLTEKVLSIQCNDCGGGDN